MIKKVVKWKKITMAMTISCLVMSACKSQFFGHEPDTICHVKAPEYIRVFIYSDFFTIKNKTTLLPRQMHDKTLPYS